MCSRTKYRTARWGALAVLLAGLSAGCREELTAPGACPEFCPPEGVLVVDSVLQSAIRRDSSYAGFVAPREGGGMQLAFDPAAADPLISRGLVRFLAFSKRLVLNAGDTVTAPVVEVDSFAVDIPFLRRIAEVTDLEVALYRLPSTVDTATTLQDVLPFFADTLLIGAAAVDDTLDDGTARVVLPGDAFPDFEADGRVAAIGLALDAPQGAYLSIGTVEGGSGLRLTRYAQVDSSGTAVPRSDARIPGLDTYVVPAMTPPGPDEYQIGGAPTSRALLRFALPPAVIDSATIVRATLVLVSTSPVRGAPGDTIQILAQAVTADVGPKSPLRVISTDSVAFQSARVPVGSSDTVRLDVTDLLRRWSLEPSAPRALMLRSIPEGSTPALARFGSTRNAGAAPTLQVTYVPRIMLGGS